MSSARHGLAAPAVALLLALLAGQALAQTSLDEPLDERSAKRLDRLEKSVKELRAIVFQGRETGQPVVVQPADTQAQVAALTDRLNELGQTLSRLNGQLEVIGHDLDQYRRETGEMHAEIAALKQQLAAAEPRAQAGPPAATPPAAEPPPEDAATAFAAARAALVAGDMTSAEAGFRDFVDRHGDGPSGPEARYYLAKTLIARRDWSEAATADIGAIRGWPRTRWAPDALVDLSRTLVALGKPEDACQTLDELVRRYPKASPAVLRGAADVRTRAKCG